MVPTKMPTTAAVFFPAIPEKVASAARNHLLPINGLSHVIAKTSVTIHQVSIANRTSSNVAIRLNRPSDVFLHRPSGIMELPPVSV